MSTGRSFTHTLRARTKHARLRRRSLLLILGVALLSAGVALADGVQRTDPDACAMFTGRLMKSVLGPGVTARPEHLPLPKLPAADPNLNHFLKVSQTSCTWANPASFAKSGIAYVRVEIYQRNDDYSGGGKRWSVNSEWAGFGRLLSSRGVTILDQGWFAARYKAQGIVTAIVQGTLIIAGDAKTGGERRIWVGYELDDGVWLSIGVAASKRPAFLIVGPLLKQVVGG